MTKHERHHLNKLKAKLTYSFQGALLLHCYTSGFDNMTTPIRFDMAEDEWNASLIPRPTYVCVRRPVKQRTGKMWGKGKLWHLQTSFWSKFISFYVSPEVWHAEAISLPQLSRSSSLLPFFPLQLHPFPPSFSSSLSHLSSSNPSIIISDIDITLKLTFGKCHVWERSGKKEKNTQHSQ